MRQCARVDQFQAAEWISLTAMSTPTNIAFKRGKIGGKTSFSINRKGFGLL